VTTILLTAAGYCATLHLMRRARAYIPPCKARDRLDTVIKVMGGGGSGPILPQ
jgi:hypothetical protein